jgi:16S rRNA (guanine527-N7)-methyltransferase
MGPNHQGDGVPDALLEVLEESLSRDLLGTMALAEQVDHALGFARAYEVATAGPGTDRGVPSATGPRHWLDLGSGGGLPGLILAQYWPRSEAVLLDSSERRTTFLLEAVQQLGWVGRVQVVRARAEDAGRDLALRAGFDVVWARSFGSPPVTAECAAPFLEPGGLLIVSEPPDAPAAPGLEDETQTAARWPREGLGEVGQEPVLRVRDRFGYQVIRQASPCPERFPRRSGVAGKRPLYRVVERS